MPLTCITCGGTMPDDSDFCPACGRAVIRQLAGDPLAAPGIAQSSGKERAPAVEKSVVREPVQPPTAGPGARVPPPVDAAARKEAGSSARPPQASSIPAPAPRIPSAPAPSAPPRRTLPQAAAAREAVRLSAEAAPFRSGAALNDRLLGAAAYFTFVPALVFVFLQVYKRRRFVRFHALQSILFWAVVAALAGISMFATTFGFLLLWLVSGILIVLALFLTWLVLCIKALQGEQFHLPLLGGIAEQFAG